MFEDDFLEFDYESRNGSNDFYTYNSRDFDETWDSDVWDETVEELNALELDMMDDYGY